jgi:prepilin-type N-terminal cleavage/methylation domain-containing protein
MGQDGMRQRRGFSLIELMVSIAVLVVIVALSVPSLQAVRQRATTRAAGDQLLSFWNQARLEAAKRNQMVKVSLTQSASGATFCLGAATTTDPDDTSPCDCTLASGSGVCDVARYPNSGSAADNSVWGGAKLTGVTLGQSNWPTASAMVPAVIEPKRTALTDTADAGLITLAGPNGPRRYQIRLIVDGLGRAVVCEPSSAVDKLSDFNGRRCSP